MRLTFKYRLLPTKAQHTAMRQSLDACRWVYNQTLEVRKTAWEQEKRSVSRYDTINMLPQWKKDKSDLRNAFSQSLQASCTRVDLAFKSFFRRVKQGADSVGYPRFKSWRRYDSFTYPQYGNGVKMRDNGKLRLSKIGAVKIKLHRPVCGNPKVVTIQRDTIGNWYACFSCEVAPNPLPPSTEVVGVDLGLTTYLMLSNGAQFERKRWLKRDEKELKRVQRRVSRLPKGSAERRKAVKALNKVHQRIANRRKDDAHKVSRALVNRYQIIAFEKLDIQSMTKKPVPTGEPKTKQERIEERKRKHIALGVADVAWSMTAQFTAYKAEDAGRLFVPVNPRGTTQDCHACGVCVPKGLSVRVHRCHNCGLVMNRDLNAAKNILSRGLSTLRTTGALEAHVIYPWE